MGNVGFSAVDAVSMTPRIFLVSVLGLAMARVKKRSKKISKWATEPRRPKHFVQEMLWRLIRYLNKFGRTC